MVKLIKRNKTKTSIITGITLYGQLRQTLAKEGIFDRSYRFYAWFSLFIFVGFFTCAYLIILLKSIPLLIMTAIIFSFFSVQIAGLLHDAGHRTIFKSTLMNDIVGYICGICLAMGYSSWKFKHNKHHAHPNQEDEDPDVSLPLLSFTKERLAKKKGIAYIVRKYQAYLYYPMGVFVGFSVRFESFKFLIKNFSKIKILEFFILGVGVIIWFALPFVFFPPLKGIILFIVINFSIGFYLLNVFAPNHKGMPQYAKNVKVSFMEQQIMTSRNIHGNWFTDFIYMGLNYQIEHHLFPNTPRNKLKKITPYVEDICNRMNLEFTRTSILQSNKIILAELREVASSL